MKIIMYITCVSIALMVSFSSCKNRSASQAQDASYQDAIHTTRNSVDWDGTYKGTIPCADCEGIEVNITLNTDETYKISYLYKGKSDSLFSASGKFTWDDKGSIITLDCTNFAPYYLVGENKLTQLDMNKEIIESAQFASMYNLLKQ